MGLLTSLFGKKTKVIVDTVIGPYTLTYSKRDKNIWVNNDDGLVRSVRGTNDAPDELQINFIKNVDAEVEKLNDIITKRFIREFKEADLPVNFINWNERFKIGALGVMLIFEGIAYWNITFEDMQEPFAHFTLYIEGNKTTDFSIDT